METLEDAAIPSAPAERPNRRRRPSVVYADADMDADMDADEDGADTAAASQHATAPPKAKKVRRSSVGAPSAAAAGISQETEAVGLHHRPVAAGRVSLCPRRLDVENGTLLCVRLVNFKSHAHFEMTFGPRLNFIVGRNGTGKSSVLAAIIVALGGNPNKHSGTAGGSKAASGLIRDGSDSASVELHIANGGADAFTLDSGAAPATLVVRLRLTRMGAEGARTSSSYAINEASATLKKVRELADFYNYEVENPTVINTQAVSASFLKDPKDAQRRYVPSCSVDPPSSRAHAHAGEGCPRAPPIVPPPIVSRPFRVVAPPRLARFAESGSQMPALSTRGAHRPP